MGDAVRYTLLARCPRSGARLGVVHTPHGDVQTPAFMPVGTRATVKGALPSQVAASGAEICLANTYHLLLRPGPDLVATMGGLHNFMNWQRPILTDSGGYQAFSMADINTVNDEGVRFKSIIDGAMIDLSPERAIEIQNKLGADIIMAFDDCPPSVGEGEGDQNDGRLRKALVRDKRQTEARKTDASGELGGSGVGRARSKGGAFDHGKRLKEANERTVRWLERCKRAHTRSEEQALFGIVQGGTDLAQRTWSAERICNIDLPGYAIGGVAVGETFVDIARVVAHTAPLLPEGKPRYLMGVGYERDLLASVLAGVDMFDCVLPTRNARNASVFTANGQLRLRNAQYATDPRPMEPGCDCGACAPAEGGVFSRAYLRHLFMVGEMLGPMLVTLHNLRHFQRFMSGLRRAIAESAAGDAGAYERLVTAFPVAREGLIGPGFAAWPSATPPQAS